MRGRSLQPPRSSVDPDFVDLAASWISDPERQFIRFIWEGFDRFKAKPPVVNERDLERSVTQLLEPRIRESMTGYEPYYVQHGPFERETMKAAPAQPPEYDLAFVLRSNEKIMWPVEAKVLETPSQVSKYANDVENAFLTCRYAPFTSSGAMVGYLLSGNSSDAFDNIAKKLGCSLETLSGYPERENRRSEHTRTAPAGKPYPTTFVCYHIVFEFPDLSRHPKG